MGRYESPHYKVGKRCIPALIFPRRHLYLGACRRYHSRAITALRQWHDLEIYALVVRIPALYLTKGAVIEAYEGCWPACRSSPMVSRPDRGRYQRRIHHSSLSCYCQAFGKRISKSLGTKVSIGFLILARTSPGKA